MEADGILASFTGTAVHDGWGPYWSYTLCRHALCHSHHERELIDVEESTRQVWARALILHLHTIKKAVAAAVAAGPLIPSRTGRDCGCSVANQIGMIHGPISLAHKLFHHTVDKRCSRQGQPIIRSRAKPNAQIFLV